MQRSTTKKKRRVEAIAAALRGARRVAIVRLGSIGDVVANVPLAWFLRDLLGSDVRIGWIVHDASAQLLHGVSAIDEVVSIPKGSLIEAVPRWKKILAEREFDVVLDVHGNLKSGLVSRLTGARTRIGFHRRDCREHWNPLFTNLRLPRLASNNKTRRAVEIAELLGHPRPAPRFDFEFDTAEQARARRVFGAMELDGRGLVILQLGRAEDVRSWPPESYARLSESLLAEGYSVLVLGGPPEEETGQKVRGLLPDVPGRLHFEINTLTLREVGAVLKVAAGRTREPSVFVGGDSGCLHLAAGCGVRSIGLFGPQDPARTSPIGEHVETLYHPEVATCIPCARRECFHETWSYCMKSITVPEVARRVSSSEKAGASAADDAAAADPAAHVSGTPPSGVTSRGGAPVPRGRAGDGQKPVRSHRLPAWELLWTLLLMSLVLALRATRAEPGGFGVESRFPGLGSQLVASGWLAALLNVLSGAGLALVTYLMGRRLGASTTGVLAAALLPGAALFLDLPGSDPAGGLFALLVNLSFLLFLEGEVRVGSMRRWCGPLSSLAAFAAFFVYGVLGVLLPAFAVIAFRAGEKALGELLRARALASAVLVAAGVFAWFFATKSAIGDRSGFLVGFFEPFLAPAGAADGGSGPFWTQATWLALWCLPASALAPFALYAHLKNRRYREDLGFADRRWRYAKCVFLSGFVLISAVPVKNPFYLLALLPALSVLSASWLEMRWHGWVGGAEGRARAVSRVLLAAGALTLGVLVVMWPASGRGVERWILVVLFAAGWLVASRVSPRTTSGLALRVVLAAVVTAAALP